MSSVGILGGSFNPPHAGHLVCARMAAEQLGLDRVLIVPLCEPSHREIADDPGPSARLALCELATEGDGLLEASDIEVARGGVSYTAQTLEELAGDEGGPQLTLILGADAAERLDSWHRPERVVELARIAVAPREGGAPAGEVARGIRDRFAGARAESFEMPRIDISSSMVRDRIGEGLSVRDLVAPSVEAAIRENGWYRQEGPA
ncbi:MAG: nicotinate (nicotinamide) nucleotide adenylyltransferase [Solirubrobacterales bacterium]